MKVVRQGCQEYDFAPLPAPLDRVLVMDIGAIDNRKWPNGPTGEFLMAHGGDPDDGICANFRVRSADGHLSPGGRARVYHVEPYWVLGDPTLICELGRNRLHEDLVALRILICLMLHVRPENIIWPGGLDGMCYDYKANGFWMKPLFKLAPGAPAVIGRMGKISLQTCHNSAHRSPTGFHCVDRGRIRELFAKIPGLMARVEIRYRYGTNITNPILRVPLARVVELLSACETLNPDELD